MRPRGFSRCRSGPRAFCRLRGEVFHADERRFRGSSRIRSAEIRGIHTIRVEFFMALLSLSRPFPVPCHPERSEGSQSGRFFAALRMTAFVLLQVLVGIVSSAAESRAADERPNIIFIL